MKDIIYLRNFSLSIITKFYKNQEEFQAILDASDNVSAHEALRKLKRENKDFQIFSGMSKIAIIFNELPDYVIKCNIFGDYSATLVAREPYFYNKAREFGIDDCFAESHYLFKFHGHTFSIMKRVDVNSKQLSEILKHEGYSESYSGFYSDTSDEVVEYICDVWYDRETSKKFRSFIMENGIGDLHTGNVGYDEDIDSYVFVDYSSY